MLLPSQTSPRTHNQIHTSTWPFGTRPVTCIAKSSFTTPRSTGTQRHLTRSPNVRVVGTGRSTERADARIARGLVHSSLRLRSVSTLGFTALSAISEKKKETKTAVLPGAAQKWVKHDTKQIKTPAAYALFGGNRGVRAHEAHICLHINYVCPAAAAASSYTTIYDGEHHWPRRSPLLPSTVYVYTTPKVKVASPQLTAGSSFLGSSCPTDRPRSTTITVLSPPGRAPWAVNVNVYDPEQGNRGLVLLAAGIGNRCLEMRLASPLERAFRLFSGIAR